MRYEIWYGKDPEELEFDCCWPDTAESIPECIDTFKDMYVASVFSTDDKKDFWNEFIEANIDPPAMWYWVIIDGVTYISGAIDPDDIYCSCVPVWVKTEVEKLRKGIERWLTNEH